MSRPSSPTSNLRNITWRRGQFTNRIDPTISSPSCTTASSSTLISPPTGGFGAQTTYTTTVSTAPQHYTTVLNTTPTSFRTYQARLQSRLEHMHSREEYFATSHHETAQNFAPPVNSSVQMPPMNFPRPTPPQFGNHSSIQAPATRHQLTPPPLSAYQPINHALSQVPHYEQQQIIQDLDYNPHRNLGQRENLGHPPQHLQDQQPSPAHTPPPPIAPEENNWAGRLGERCNLPNCNRMGLTTINCTRCYNQFHCTCIGLPEGSQNTRNMQFKCNLCLEFSNIENQLSTLQNMTMRPTIHSPTFRYKPLPINIPKFNGKKEEDPNDFIEKCEANLEAAACPPDQWLYAVTPNLRDRANDWWITQKTTCRTWQDFVHRFLNYFNGTLQLVSTQAAFYGEAQQQDEPSDRFIANKLQMWRRLYPNSPDNAAITPILQMMKPSLRPYLITIPPTSIEQLLSITSNLEQSMQPTQTQFQEKTTFQRQYNNYKQNTRTQQTYNHNYNNNAQATFQEAHKCKMCPGYHLHKYCPLRQQRNNYETSRGNNNQQSQSNSRTTPTNIPPAVAGTSSQNRFESKLVTTVPNIQLEKVSDKEALIINNPPKETNLDNLHLIRIPSYLNNKRLNTLIDTGATANIISAQHLDQERIEPIDQRATIADKKASLRITGKTIIDIEIEGATYSIICYSSTELSEDLILGQPFLNKFNAILDYTRESMTIGTDRRHIIYWHEPPPSNCEVEFPAVITSHIPEPSRTDLLNTLKKHKQVFNDEGVLGHTSLMTHSIQLTDQRPFKQYP